jgi:hemerythrin-like domain-containing protein
MAEISPVVGALVRIHRLISRALGVSIQKCDEYLAKGGVPAEEGAGFVMYVTTLKWVVHAHHLTEDELAFPYFRDKLEAPYPRLQEDHRTVARLLVGLDRCLGDVPTQGVGRLRELLGELDRLWVPHIAIEEERFTAERLNRVVGMQEQVGLVRQFGEHGGRNAGPGPLAMPFMFYNLEGAERAAFVAPMPWFLKNVLVPIAWRGQWKPMRPFLIP